MRRRVTKKLRRRRACATVDGLLDALPITAYIDHRDLLGLHRVLLFGIRVLIFACGSSDLTRPQLLGAGLGVPHVSGLSYDIHTCGRRVRTQSPC